MTRTSVDILGTADSNGVFYYYIGAEGTDAPTTEQIVDTIGDFFNLLDTPSTEIEDSTDIDPYDEVDPNETDKAD